ncbi:MAG: nucleotidyltransferase family protein [Anaerolineae bacterium]
MNGTALGVTPETMARYRATARRRAQAQQVALARRREHAWQIARRAATLLTRQFEARQVFLFGSLAHGYWFNERSDIDLAVSGLPPGAVWRAWSAMEEICEGFEINLVEMEAASDLLLQQIEAYGCEL